MDHKEFVSSLSVETREALTRKSDLRGLAHLTGHWGAIVLLGVLIAIGAPFWPLLMVGQGVLLVFLFTLLHETSHKTPFASKWLNEAVGHICGFLLFLPATWFRYFHFAHHRFTQIPGKDPELAAPKPETWGQYLAHLSGLPIWVSHAKTLLNNAKGGCTEDYVPEARRPEITREARLYLATYAVLFAVGVLSGATWLLYTWLIPILLGQPFLRVYLMAEHGRCAFVANMLENSRTTFTNRLIRAIAWNMPYHAEHHSFPTVPFYKLPDLHREIRPHLMVTERGYGRFHVGYAKTLGNGGG